MAESLPGTMSIFGEALATLTGSGLTGQAAIQELYRATEAGEVVSAEILPIVAEIMSERAQPKLGIMKRSSIAESARVVNMWNDLLKNFSEAGGEKGFSQFFRTLAEQLPRLTPLVTGFGAAFGTLGEKAGLVVRVFADYTQIMSSVKRTFDEIDPSIIKVVGSLALLSTRIGRIMLPLTGVFLILEDIAVGLTGGEALSGYLFDFLDKFVAYDKKILGLTMAIMSVVAAFAMLRRVTGFGLPGSKDRKREKGGRGVGLLGGLLAVGSGLLLNPWVSIPLALGVAGHWGYNTDTFQSAIMSSEDKWLNRLAHTGAGITGWKEQREYWNNLFSSSERGFLTGRDVEAHFSSTERGRQWLNNYLQGESKVNPGGTRSRWLPHEREDALDEMANRINKAYSSSRMISSGDYIGPLSGDVEGFMGSNNPSNYVENLNSSAASRDITVNNEVNLNADGILDPEGVRDAMEGLIPELQEATREVLQNLLSTTQDAYGG